MILLSTLSSFKGDKDIVFHVLCCLHSLAVPCEYPLCMLSDLHVERRNVSFLDCVCGCARTRVRVFEKSGGC